MDRQLPVWASVALVAVVSALLLVSTHLVTQVFAPPEGAIGKDSAQGEALPAAELFVPVEMPMGTGLDTCYVGTVGGKPVGYVAQATVKGYGGPIEVVVGMDMNGLLTGISVGGEQFNESPGLGAKSKDPEFKNQFVGIETPVGLNKSDATSSATQSGEWSANATSGATQNESAATAAPAADATSSATTSGDWSVTAAPADAPASATQTASAAATASAADATSSATTSGEWTATTAPADAPASAVQTASAEAATPATDATSSATTSGDWSATTAPADAPASAVQTASAEAATPAADATSSATTSGDWSATTAPAADVTAAPVAQPTVAPAVETASAIDAISGATITSTAVVNCVNQCAFFMKTLLTGVSG